MKQTSETYKVRMAESFRRRSYLRVTVEGSGQTYYFEDNIISGATKNSDVDPLSRKLPIESFDFSIIDFSGEYDPSNPSGKWKAIDENAEISVEFGFNTGDAIEWLDPDIYLLTGRPSFSNGLATFNATSRLRHLTNKYYKGTEGVHTLYELAEDVLQDAGVVNYNIDSSLLGITTTAALPIDEAQNLLQMIAHAGCCALFTVGDTITIAPVTDAGLEFSSVPISLRDIASDGDAISKNEPLRSIKVNKYNYIASASEEVISENTIEINGTLDYHCEFNQARNISVTISAGGAISNLQVYSSAIDCTITGTGTFTVTVKGYPVSASSDVLVQTINAFGGEDTESNPIVTDDANQINMIYTIAAYLELRTTQTLNYRGSPELEALDGVYIEGTSGYAPGLILQNKIQYDGAISGQMIVKRLDETSGAQLYDSDDQEIMDSSGNALWVIGTEPYYSEYTGDEMDAFVSSVLGE